MGIALASMAEIGLIAGSYHYDYYRGYSFADGVMVAAGSATAVAVTFLLLALFALFQTNVLDYFYPRHAPHPRRPERSIAFAAWSQILVGFWLLLPLILGIGLLYRKRWALRMDCGFLGLGVLVAITMAILGMALGTQSATWQGVFLVPIGHLLFLFTAFNLHLLTRREVKALF
jgi:hypothetical protein